MEPTGKTYVGSDELYADVQRTMRLCAEMNSGYHTEAEVRDCLREITKESRCFLKLICNNESSNLRKVRQKRP